VAGSLAGMTGQRLRFFPELFFLELFFLELFFPVRFFGTLAPFERASDRPIAIACLRLFTLPPEPERRVPFFLRRIALSTRLPAAFPYLRLPPLFFRLLFFAAIHDLR
jgi:hypothetical protein